MRGLCPNSFSIDRNSQDSQIHEFLDFGFAPQTKFAITAFKVGRPSQIFVFRSFVQFLRGGVRGFTRNQLSVDQNLDGTQKREFNDCSHKHILSPD